MAPVNVRRRAFPLLFGALAVTQVVYGRSRRTPAATRGVVGLMLATSLAEARRPVPVLAAGAIGFGAELVGVATGHPFGHYSYSDRLGPRVGGVPLLAAAAWAMMARPAWAVAGRIASRPAARIPLAAAALTAWDVYLDPRMVREGYWTWPGGGRYEGVPATNFAGWFATGLVVFAALGALEAQDARREAGRDQPPEARAAAPGLGAPAGARVAARGDDGAVALYAWTWLGEAIANAFIWRHPRVALAGGAAMGAFAIPALLRRP
ncbi:carotenoid biosynthesis protein [Solirubrobacter phytolaccae]|uniref:Carotenoid biosynthesis protein n=1 Tax=Solirubrobacter phytolaccae TaxID=1404360 RepID=A0A9X3SBJ8_9ACTN|nr:carotenoid biosynthesis protein [Solirubrobacter phytolaccae]MDA0181520.1 carotenoid biosynthesis protein [Solirubrobacter phytolaccae]